MLKSIFIVLVIAVVALLLYARRRPGQMHVERSLRIAASPEKIFALVNDLHAWESWSPYLKDPAMKKTYSGAASGAGASYAWSGNSKVGQGSITITEALAPSRIAFNLDMLKPFEGHNKVLFSIVASKDEANQTDVTWVMWRISMTTAHAMPTCTAVVMSSTTVSTKVTSMMALAGSVCARNAVKACHSPMLMATPTRMAASAASGTCTAHGAATSTMTSRVPACTTPATGVCAPLRILAEVRAMVPVAANPPNSGTARLAMPCPINS